MNSNQHEEHLAYQPDNSRWDGFDRGDVDQSGDEDLTLAANEELLAEMRAEGLL